MLCSRTLVEFEGICAKNKIVFIFRYWNQTDDQMVTKHFGSGKLNIVHTQCSELTLNWQIGGIKSFRCFKNTQFVFLALRFS